MKIEYVKAPVWANPEHSLVNLTIKWDRFAEELPFTADPDDVEEHGRALFASALAGEFGEIAEYVAPIEPEHEPESTPSSGNIPVTEA